MLADVDSPVEGGLPGNATDAGKADPDRKGIEDTREVLAAGVTGEQIEDARAVCSAFNTTNRLADAFDFEQLSPAGSDAGARYLLKRGYRQAVNIRSMPRGGRWSNAQT